MPCFEARRLILLNSLMESHATKLGLPFVFHFVTLKYNKTTVSYSSYYEDTDDIISSLAPGLLIQPTQKGVHLLFTKLHQSYLNSVNLVIKILKAVFL